MASQVYTPVSGKDDDIPLAEDVSIVTGLLNHPAVGTLPKVTGQSMMQVTAPATLPEGYEFPVKLGSLQFKVQVPLGGVEQGQVFTVPVPGECLQTASVTSSIPVGAWRDDEYGCWNYGTCHPHIWTSFLCPLRKSIDLFLLLFLLCFLTCIQFSSYTLSFLYIFF
jgi:hypothetical protein